MPLLTKRACALAVALLLTSTLANAQNGRDAGSQAQGAERSAHRAVGIHATGQPDWRFLSRRQALERSVGRLLSRSRRQRSGGGFQKFLTRFEAIDSTGFPDQEALNKTLIIRDLKLQLEGARFKPSGNARGPAEWHSVSLPFLVTVLSFPSVKDYEDYISRLKQIPRVLDQVTVQMRKGINDKLMPPRFVLQEALEQCKVLTAQTPEKSTFSQPFFNFPKEIRGPTRSGCARQGLRQ